MISVPRKKLFPVSSLKKLGFSTLPRGSENKSVILSDGIRPGGDLTELNGSLGHRPLGRRPVKVKNRRVAVRGGGARGGTTVAGDICRSWLPQDGLPMVSGRSTCFLFCCRAEYEGICIRVGDPDLDPSWIQLQDLCGSVSGSKLDPYS